MTWLRVLSALDGQVTVDLDWVADPSTVPDDGSTPTTNQVTVQGIRWANTSPVPVVVELRRNQVVAQTRTIPAGNSGSRDLSLDFAAAQRRNVSLNARWPA